MTTLSELVNDIKFKTDWRTLDKVKAKMKALDKDAARLRKSVAKPLKMKMDAGGFNKAKSDMERLSNQATQLRQKLTRPMRVSIDGGQLASVRAQMRATGSEATSLRSKLLAFGAGFGGGAMMMGAAKGLFDTNVELARLKGALKTTMGSTAAANAKFAELQKFGANTPFTLDQSVKAFVNLKNLGLDPSDRALRSFGNTATAFGNQFTDVIEAISDATTGDFESLKEAFKIKSKQMGESVEFTFRGVKTKVKKDAKSIQEYLMSIGEKNFSKAMKDQMDALPGVVSNVEDAFQSLQLAIGEGGMNAAIIPILKEIGSVLGGIDGAALGAALGKGITAISNGAKGAVSGVKQLVQNLGGLKGVAEKVTLALGLMLAPLIGSQIMAAATGLQGLVAAARGLTILSAGQGLFALLGGLPMLIGLAVVAVGALAYDIYQFATGGSSVIGSLAARFPQFGQFVQMVGDYFKSMVPTIQSWGGSLMTIAQACMSMFESLGLILFSAFQVALPIIMGVVDALFQIWGAVAQIAMAFISLALQIFAALYPLIAFFMQIFSVILSVVIGFVGLVLGAFLSLVIGGIAIWARLVAAVVVFCANLLTAVAAFAAAGIQFFIQLFTNPKAAAQNFYTAVIGIINNLKSAFKNLVSGIVSAFVGGFGTIKGIIRGLAGGVNGILNKIKGAGSAAGKISFNVPGGGGRGSTMTASIYTGGNTYNVGGMDPVQLGALVNKQSASGVLDGLSDYARSMPMMLPGSIG